MKDYDSTLARIAGNIASGLVGQAVIRRSVDIANEAVEIAIHIVDECRSYQAWKEQQDAADKTTKEVEK